MIDNIHLDSLDIVQVLTDKNAVTWGHYKGTSGKHLNCYVHKDRIFEAPDLRTTILFLTTNIILDIPNPFEVVTGPAVAGAIFAALLVSRLGKKIFVYPEKIDARWDKSLGWCGGRMAFRRGYDKTIKDKRVLILEDVVTTGGSVRKTINAVQECGGQVAAVVAIWDRAEAGDLGVPFFPLIRRPLSSWEEENCPMCKEGIPVEKVK